MRVEQQEFPPNFITEILNTIESTIAKVDKPIIILSDLDYTLFSEYNFNPKTNDHIPRIKSNLVAAAQNQHLITATGRRADNPTIPLLWESGLIPVETPAIVENGGILAINKKGKIEFIELVDTSELTILEEIRSIITERLKEIPGNLKLVFKRGRTMLVARLQDQKGFTMPHYQEWLEDSINAVISTPNLRVVNSRVSVTIQHKNINKRTAFQHYLNIRNISRDNVFVIGMGDGENDKEIFDEADLRIGFSDAVKSMVDINVPHGAILTPDILNAMKIRNTGKVSQREIGKVRRISHEH